MTHTFKNKPNGIIDYAIVNNERIYVGDSIVITDSGISHSVEIIKIDVTDFKQSVCYIHPLLNKEFWPHRGTYHKARRAKKCL